MLEFKKVTTKEIKSILERLETELRVGELPLEEREENKTLINYLKTWLEWQDFRKPVEPCGTITQTKDFFSFKSENMGIFPKPEIERKDNNKRKNV